MALNILWPSASNANPVVYSAFCDEARQNCGEHCEAAEAAWKAWSKSANSRPVNIDSAFARLVE
jgi:hypothetical protein